MTFFALRDTIFETEILEAVGIKKALVFAVLSFCILFSSCSKTEQGVYPILNKYISAESTVNEGYAAYNSFLFITDNFMCKAEFSGMAIKPKHVVDFADFFGKETKVNHLLNPSGTMMLLYTKDTAYIYSVEQEKTEKLSISTSIDDLIGWVSDNIIMSAGKQTENFKAAGGDIKIKGKGIAKENVYLLHNGKVLAKNGTNGMCIIEFNDAADIVRYYDGEKSAPMYTADSYAVFGTGSDKRIFDVESEQYTELGPIVSAKIRGDNIACVTDKYVCIYTSSATIKRYEIYAVDTDSKINTQKIELSGDVRSGFKGTLIFEDTENNYYFLENSEYRLAETREGQATGLYFIIHPRETYKYDVLGYDAEGHIYEYYADLTL